MSSRSRKPSSTISHPAGTSSGTVRAAHERHRLAEQRTGDAQLVLAAREVEAGRDHERRVVADRHGDRQALAALARRSRSDREVVVGGDADERARAAERAHARDRPVALTRLGVARDDAAGGDVRPALVLEEARDRQPREIGIALDDLLARRRRRSSTGSSGASSARCRSAPRPRSSTPSASAMSARPGQQVRDEGQLAAVHARDAHGLAVERDETCGEPGRRVERLADLDQPAVVRELREPRPQRLRVSPRHRARPSARARRPRRGRGRSSRPPPRSRSARAPGSRARAVPRPSGEQPRTSTACAATTRPSASSSSPTATCSLSRRAASGAIVMRSSMPSASNVEAVSVRERVRRASAPRP